MFFLIHYTDNLQSSILADQTTGLGCAGQSMGMLDNLEKVQMRPSLTGGYVLKAPISTLPAAIVL